MKTNQWFKLAVLAFAGIIISSTSLSLLNSSSGTQSTMGITTAQQDPNNHSAHVQSGNQQDPNSHSSHTQNSAQDNGMANYNGQMSQTNQMGQMNQMQNPLSWEQLNEMQLRIWNMQARLDALRQQANYGYGNMYGNGMVPGYANGYAPGPQTGQYGGVMQPGNNMGANGMNNMSSMPSNGMNNMSNMSGSGNSMSNSSSGGMSMM